MKICVVSLHAYPIVAANATGVFGGTETRAVTIARGLQQFTDHNISFLARNSSLQQTTEIDGIRWIPWRDFWTELRYEVSQEVELFPRWPYLKIRRWSRKLVGALFLLLVTRPFRRYRNDSLKRAPLFDQLDVDLFLVFGVHAVSAQVLFNAHHQQKKAILFLGANNDLDDRYTADSTYVTPYQEKGSVAYTVLQQADAIVTQNDFQQQKLAERFPQPSLQLNNPLDLDQWQKLSEKQIPQYQIPYEKYLLWIGRADNFHKRAPLCLEIARAIPHIPVVMVMNPRDQIVQEQIQRNLPANVHIIQQVDYSDIPALFHNAIAFLNTSSAEYEGFPNTFLQASAAGIPILSLEVGKEYLQENQTGWSFSGDLSALITFLQSRLNHETLLIDANCLLPAEYQLKTVIDDLNQFIANMCTQ